MTWRTDHPTDRPEDEPEAVLHAVERMLGALAVRPHRMRVRTADFVIDLDWSVPAEAAAPAEPVGRDAPEQSTPESDASEPDTSGHHEVLAPSIGTFYRAAEPGSTPFVTEGQRVERGRQVAIVEIMKLMLAVEADVAGTVVEVLKADGDPVEYGEPLLVIAPDEAA